MSTESANLSLVESQTISSTAMMFGQGNLERVQKNDWLSAQGRFK